MTRNKLILACLTILSIVLNVSALELQKLGPAEQVFVSNKKVRMGSGVDPNHLPILEYFSNATRIDFKVLIVPKKQCSFTVFAHEGNANAETVKQLSGNKVLFIWSEERKVGKNSKFSGSSRKYATTISLLDMNTCVNVKNHEFTWNMTVRDNYIDVVPFEDGFDVFTSKNRVTSHVSFDINGNEIAKNENYPINPYRFSIRPVSVKSRTRDFFILDYGNEKLNLINADGTVVKTLLQFHHSLEISINSDESLYSACWQNSEFRDDHVTVQCQQFDEFGNKKLDKEEQLEFDSILDVKNLKGGGVLIAVWSYSDDKLNIITMKPGSQTNIWSYSMSREIGKARLMHFNENEDTFSLAYEAHKIVKGGKGLEISIVLQKFSLPSVSQN